MEYILSDIIELIGGGTPKTSVPEYWDGDIPWLSVKDFSGEKRYVYETEKCITEEGLNNSSTKYLHQNDIIVSARGTVGKMAMIPFPMTFNQSCYGIRANSHLVDPFYLYYLMKYNLAVLKSKVHGSVFDTITKDTFKQIKVDLPDLEVQKKVADILGNLDDKIENNEKINRNLEEHGKVLFKSYFIDYTPYGGSVPKTWGAATLGDVCSKITDGAHYSPADVPGAPYPMYSVKDMETYGFNPNSCKHIEDEELQKMKRNDCVPKLNDILVAKDGSYLKEIFICSEEKDEAILSSIAIFRPNTKIIEPEILLYLLKQPSIRKDVGDNFVSGSALPRIVLKDFKKYTFVLPPISEQHKISNILHSFRMQIKTNVNENMRLISLRDNLLPKLMSGELDVTSLEI